MGFIMSKSLGKNALFNAIYNVSNIVFPFIINIYASRILLADGIGKVGYGQNIASYFVALATLGLPTYGAREISKERDETGKNKTFTELLIINTITTIFAIICYLILVLSQPKLAENQTLYWICGIQIFLNFINIDWLYVGFEEFQYIAIRRILIKFVSLILIFLFVKRQEDYLVYALITTVGISINYLFNIIHAKKYISLYFKGLRFRRHVKPLVILGLSMFLSTAYSRVDVTMLGAMLTESTIGIYNNAHKIVEIVITLCISVTGIFFPRLSYYYSHNKSEFLKLLSNGIRIISFICFPAFIGFWIVSPYVITICYGDSFSAAGITARIFAPLIIIRGFGDLLCSQLAVATGNEGKRTTIYFFAAVINIILNVLLIPSLQENGAAVASIVSEMVINFILFIWLKKALHYNVPYKDVLEGVLTSMIMGVVVYLVSEMFGITIIGITVSIISGIVIYIMLNFMIKNQIMFLLIDKIKSRWRGNHEESAANCR